MMAPRAAVAILEAVGVPGLSATVPLGFTALLAWTVARRSATTRRLLWIFGFVAVGLLPLVRAAVPGPRIRLAASGATDSGGVMRSFVPAVGSAVGPTLSEAAGSGGPEPAVESAAPRVPGAAVQLLLLVWAGGALFLTLRLLTGLDRRRGMSRRARPAGCGWPVLLEELARTVGAAGRPRLLASVDSADAQTWGMARPVILLPEAAETWPEQRRRMVLLHEMVHVVRYDSAFLVAARFVCCLIWFNPVVWLAHRRLRLDIERACDDRVLALTGHAEGYARELVGLARLRRSARRVPVTAAALVRRRELELRIEAILDRRNLRGRSPLPATLLGAGMLAMVTVLAGGVRAERVAPVTLTGPSAYRWVEENADGGLDIIDVDLQGTVRLSSDSTRVVEVGPGGRLTVVQLTGDHHPIQSVVFMGEAAGGSGVRSLSSPVLTERALQSWLEQRLPSVARTYFHWSGRAVARMQGLPARLEPIDRAGAQMQAERFREVYLDVFRPLLAGVMDDVGVDSATRLTWDDEVSTLLEGRLSLTVGGGDVSVASEDGTIADTVRPAYLARLDRSAFRLSPENRDRLSRVIDTAGARFAERWRSELLRGRGNSR